MLSLQEIQKSADAYLNASEAQNRAVSYNLLTPYQKLLKLKIEAKVKLSTDGRAVKEILTTNPNHFTTELAKHISRSC